jgi:hypothetical protein
MLMKMCATASQREECKARKTWTPLKGLAAMKGLGFSGDGSYDTFIHRLLSGTVEHAELHLSVVGNVIESMMQAINGNKARIELS